MKLTLSSLRAHVLISEFQAFMECKTIARMFSNLINENLMIIENTLKIIFLRRN